MPARPLSTIAVRGTGPAGSAVGPALKAVLGTIRIRELIPMPFLRHSSIAGVLLSAAAIVLGGCDGQSNTANGAGAATGPGARPATTAQTAPVVEAAPRPSAENAPATLL